MHVYSTPNSRRIAEAGLKVCFNCDVMPPSSAIQVRGSIFDIRLTHKELRQLKPGDWVAWKRNWPISWPKDNWTTPDWKEGQLTEYPLRSAQHITVWIHGLPHQVSKSHLFKVQPVVSVEEMHQDYDYNS